MFNTIKETWSKYSIIYLNSWWGIWVVNISLVGGIYAALWTIIEPLSIPDKIVMGNYYVDRRFAHILLSLFSAAYGSLFITTFAKWTSNSQESYEKIAKRRNNPNNESLILSIDEIKKIAEINKFHADLNWQTSEQLKSSKAEINFELKKSLAEKTTLEQSISLLRSEIQKGNSATKEQAAKLENAISDRDKLEHEVFELRQKLIEAESKKDVLLAEIEELKPANELGRLLEYDKSFSPPAPIVNLNIKAPFHVSQYSGEVTATMILDTGADFSALPKKIISDLEEQIDSKLPYSRAEVQGFNGVTSTLDLYFLQVDSFVDSNSVEKSINIEFLVTNDEHGVLGRDFLSNYVVSFDGLKSTFRIFRP